MPPYNQWSLFKNLKLSEDEINHLGGDKAVIELPLRKFEALIKDKEDLSKFFGLKNKEKMRDFLKNLFWEESANKDDIKVVTITNEKIKFETTPLAALTFLTEALEMTDKEAFEIMETSGKPTKARIKLTQQEIIEEQPEAKKVFKTKDKTKIEAYITALFAKAGIKEPFRLANLSDYIVTIETSRIAAMEFLTKILKYDEKDALNKVEEY